MTDSDAPLASNFANTQNLLRLAAEMLARFNDPFYRFYARLATADKSMSMQRLIKLFQQSSQFLTLRKKMREELIKLEFNEIDEDENVLVR